MPTDIVFVGGEKTTVAADLNEAADMLSHARPARVERVHVTGAPRGAYVNSASVLYVQEAQGRVPQSR